MKFCEELWGFKLVACQFHSRLNHAVCSLIVLMERQYMCQKGCNRTWLLSPQTICSHISSIAPCLNSAKCTDPEHSNFQVVFTPEDSHLQPVHTGPDVKLLLRQKIDLLWCCLPTAPLQMQKAFTFAHSSTAGVKVDSYDNPEVRQGVHFAILAVKGQYPCGSL